MSLSELGRYRQCGCKIVSSWKSHNVAIVSAMPMHGMFNGMRENYT